MYTPHFFESRWDGFTGNKAECRQCGQPEGASIHVAAYADQAGFDVTMCPGCELSIPTDLTVRMMRFVHPVTKEVHGKVRVCRPCAGFADSRPVLLALLHDRGLLDADRYATLLQEAMSP